MFADGAEAGRRLAATAVAPPDTIELLRPEADEMVCLDTPRWFTSIGSFYRDFRQVSDEDVIRLLANAPYPARASVP